MTLSVKRDGWATVKIGDLCKIKHGFAFKGEYFSDSGDYVLLTPGNFSERDGLRLRGDKEKYYTGEVPKDYLLQKGAMLVVMTDLKQDAPYLGAPGIVRETNLLHNQRLGLVEEVNEDLVVPDFLYWIFQSNTYRAQVRGSATGATVRHTAPDRLYACSINIPENLEIQRKIASILFTFDNLIENNMRRIKILEDMAQLIYREWFVHYRFPNHEKVKMINSGTELGIVPEGWDVKKLGDVMVFAYGKALKSEDRRDGNIAVLGSSGVVGWHNEPLVSAPGIVVGRKGNVGSVHWVAEDFWPIDTTFYVETKLPLQFCFFALQHQNFISGDVAVPGLNRGQAYLNDFLVPKESLLKEFAELANPFFQQVEKLSKCNSALRKARDMLLPKLMSGQLVVA